METFLAKPTGISLKEHTSNVIDESKNYIAVRSFVFEKYNRLIGATLQDSINKVCKYHDLGKKYSQWQNACKKEFDNYRSTSKVSGKYLRDAKVRHEIYSAIFCQRNNITLSEEELTAILAHHGKLSVLHQDKWEVWCNGTGKDLWKKCKQISNRADKWNFSKVILESYKYDSLRAILQFADKRASAKEENELIAEYTSFNYSFNPDWIKRPVQQLAETFATDNLLLLRAPTGAGKTDAALLWAAKQIKELKRADRLIIALPTRFTSNALAVKISSAISETGVYHSTSKLLDTQSVLLNGFAKLLETPVTVCTIDHLLIVLSKTKEDHHLSSFNLANSCLVVDEADFYDAFTQANLLVLLEALCTLKVPVLLMSASLPESSLQLYQRSGYGVKDIKEDRTDYSRTRCNVVAQLDYENFDDVRDVLVEATKQPSIIYVNTVDKAIKLKRWFTDNFPRHEVILYHSRFTESDKQKKEDMLIESLGKKAWSESKAKGITILTQIGEMSVNISADYMVTDVCPIDRLVQRAGRLSRFKNEAGNLKLLIPHQNGNLYPAPYGSFNSGSWIANESLEKTLTLLQTGSYSAKDFVDLVNKVYENGLVFLDKATTNAKKFRELIKANWLILPGYELDEGKDSGNWKTRDMTGQAVVLTLTPDELEQRYFKSYVDFEKLMNRFGISCPVYLVKKNLESGRLIINKVIITDDEEPVILLSSQNMYNSIYGLDLSTSKEGDQFP